MHAVLGLPQLLAAIVTATAAPSTANDPLHVDWTVNAEISGCPSETQLETRLRARLGPRLDDRRRIEVTGTLSQGEGTSLHLRLLVVADDETRVRELQGPECEALADAAVLIASLAVGGDPMLEPVDSAPRTEPDVTPPATASDPPPTSSSPPIEPLREVEPSPPPRKLGVEGWVALGAGAAWGQVPSVGAVVDARTAAAGPRWVAQIGLRYAAPRRALAPGFDDRGVVVQAWSIGVQGGARWPVGTRVRIPTTIGIELGAVHGRGFGVPTRRRRALPWLAPAVESGVEVWLSRRIALWAQARLAVSLGRPSFQILGRGVVFRSERVSPSGTVGVMISLG